MIRFHYGYDLKSMEIIFASGIENKVETKYYPRRIFHIKRFNLHLFEINRKHRKKKLLALTSFELLNFFEINRIVNNNAGGLFRFKRDEKLINREAYIDATRSQSRSK